MLRVLAESFVVSPPSGVRPRTTPPAPVAWATRCHRAPTMPATTTTPEPTRGHGRLKLCTALSSAHDWQLFAAPSQQVLARFAGLPRHRKSSLSNEANARPLNEGPSRPDLRQPMSRRPSAGTPRNQEEPSPGHRHLS